MRTVHTRPLRPGTASPFALCSYRGQIGVGLDRGQGSDPRHIPDGTPGTVRRVRPRRFSGDTRGHRPSLVSRLDHHAPGETPVPSRRPRGAKPPIAQKSQEQLVGARSLKPGFLPLSGECGGNSGANTTAPTPLIKATCTRTHQTGARPEVATVGSSRQAYPEGRRPAACRDRDGGTGHDSCRDHPI